MLESDYQSLVLDRIRDLCPGCVILKNDSGYQQGIPDWIILWYGVYACLEIKKDKRARKQPNQDWWVEKINEMSFAAFIYPEIEDEVIHALQQSFRTSLTSRLSQP